VALGNGVTQSSYGGRQGFESRPTGRFKELLPGAPAQEAEAVRVDQRCFLSGAIVSVETMRGFRGGAPRVWRFDTVAIEEILPTLNRHR